MRKHRSRWPLAVGLLLCVFALLVLLSALVETPQSAAAAAAPAENSQPVANTVLVPAVMPTHEVSPESRGAYAAFLSLAFIAYLTLSDPLPVMGRDANGRVLRRRSYTRSFYPVFHQELACG